VDECKPLMLGAEELAAAVAAEHGPLVAALTLWDVVGQCRLTVSKPVLKAPVVSALATITL
jgi:hypothetical protein